MPEPVHQLTHPGELTTSAVVCGDPHAQMASWDANRVTCPVCRTPRGERKEGPFPAPKTPFPPRVTHKAFQGQVVALLQLYGWTYYYTWNAKHSPEGFPDLVAMRESNGRVRGIAFELKVGADTPSAAQQHWLTLFAGLPHWTTAVWYPDDLDAIHTVLSLEER